MDIIKKCLTRSFLRDLLEYFISLIRQPPQPFFFYPIHNYIKLYLAIKNTVPDPEQYTKRDKYQSIQLSWQVFMKCLLWAQKIPIEPK